MQIRELLREQVTSWGNRLRGASSWLELWNLLSEHSPFAILRHGMGEVGNVYEVTHVFQLKQQVYGSFY